VSELTEKRAFIRSFVQSIRVVGDEATLTYVMPLNGLIEQRIGVLSIVQYGGPKGTFAKPSVETFFEVSISSAPSGNREQADNHS